MAFGTATAMATWVISNTVMLAPVFALEKGIWGMLAYFFGFGEVFHNNVWWTRAFAMKEKVAPRAFLLSGVLWFPIPIAAGFIALSAAPLGINVTDPNTVGPLVAGALLGTLGAMVVFVVVFCSLASSIDSLLAATSDLVCEDVYRRMLRPQAEERTLRRMAGWFVVGLGVVTWLICRYEFDLLTVLFLSGPLVASAIWPVIAGLYWERTNRQSVVLAMILGSGVGLVAYFLIGLYTASLISAALSMATVVIGTRLFPEPVFDWNQLNESAP